MKQGFLKAAAITPQTFVGNPKANVKEMLKILKTVQADLAVFPELSITSYTANDLFFQSSLLDEAKEAVKQYLAENEFEGISIIGCPLDIDGALYNCAFVIKKKQILGIVPKYYLPNTQEFYEKRWFKSGRDSVIREVHILGQTVPFGALLFQDQANHVTFGVEICEDMWATVSPGNLLSLSGANIIVNLSASNEVLYKSDTRKIAILDHSRRNVGAYVYASAGVSESTSETVFSGHNVMAQTGELIVETEHFNTTSEVIYGDIDIEKIQYKRRLATSLRDSLHHFAFHPTVVMVSFPQMDDFPFSQPLNPLPFVPQKKPFEAFEKMASLQEYALFKRLKHIGSRHLVIGVSGGLDSTLALLVAHQAFLKLGFDTSGIVAITMPGLATSKRTKKNADALMKALNVTSKDISIHDSVLSHLQTINHDLREDITYENAQARMRTLILMNVANQVGGIVLGTGDLSELALGWCTYNGDQMSMYGINAGLPKTTVQFMVTSYVQKYPELKDVLLDIVDTPISPELHQNQETENVIGRYDINDFILHRFLVCGDSASRIVYLINHVFKLTEEESKTYVKRFFKRFYSQQFKRQALPDGPKILDISLSPRGDFRMPSAVFRGDDIA